MAARSGVGPDGVRRVHGGLFAGRGRRSNAGRFHATTGRHSERRYRKKLEPIRRSTRRVAATRATLPLGTCDVRDFGATGDGVTNDAVAIQKAIDHCSKVVVSAGTYQVAPLFLKSNFTLQLDQGATLQGPTDLLGYYAGVPRNGGTLPR